ncbi:uncharacterized protein [Phaseolus vulgaris]|uniref:uncharacterized protein n=1 Tax=Phaseolus vulgaris TaxID=3885 RepID=UPI0035CAFE24
MGNRVKVPMEAVGTYRLILDIGFYLDLMDTFYVPSISRNLVSLSKLDVVGYYFKFGNGCFNLYKTTCLIGFGTLYDGLYKLNLDNLYTETLMISHHNVGIKHSLVDECPAFLWHKRLGHISKEMMQRLVKNEILPNLNFTDLNVCVDLNALEVNINEVERLLDIKVKVVRSNRGGEYYGKYDEIGQHPGSFAKFLEKCGICAQYTMSVEPLSDEEEQQINDHGFNNELVVEQPREIVLRRSQREIKFAISNDYVVYLQESENDLGIDNDLVSFSEAINGDNSDKWLDAMKDELKSLAHNDARLIVKGFTQKDDIDYKETFSPISKKDSLRIIMALVVHYDLKLHQMDVKTAFLNGNLEEGVYMDQPIGFIEEEKEHMVYKLKKSIYGLI